MPGVRALPGSAGVIPLPDASVDVVLAGNAMRWFDMAVAGPEIARVLAPGGILGGLWNVMEDRVDWVAGLARVSGSAAIGPRDTPAGWRVETAEAPSRDWRARPVRLPGAGRVPAQATLQGDQAARHPCEVPTAMSRLQAEAWASWEGRTIHER